MEKHLLVLEEGIDEFREIITTLSENSIYPVKLVTLHEMVSDEYSSFFKSTDPSNIIIAGNLEYLESVDDRLNELFRKYYNIICNNCLALSSDIRSCNTVEVICGKKNAFYLSNHKREPLEQFINLNAYIIKMFYEITTQVRLSDYIIDSFHEIVDSELLKVQKKKIEELNRELDLKNQELMNELMMAQRVQSSIIPGYDMFADIEGFNYGFYYSPMENLGGDLFDIIRVGKNKYGFLMADVSGHGVPAALITTMAKVFFNEHSRYGVKPDVVCKRVHDEIYRFFGDLYYYLTAFYGVLNLETAKFEYANCGHEPALFYKADTDTIKTLEPNGTLIGILDDPVYEMDTINLGKRDKILMVTDGIIEARNEKEEFYTYDRLNSFMSMNCSLPPKIFVDELMENVREFCGQRVPDDDRAVLYLEFMRIASAHQ